MNIGIYTVSSQSGRAFLVDMVKQGHQVYGYARESEHGKEFIQAITDGSGIYLSRPEPNANHEKSHFIPLATNAVGHDLARLVNKSDVIIIAHPSQYLVQTIARLRDAGITERKIPLILAPSRTFAVPYLWDLLGQGYPFVCFSTCPYSCKAPDSSTVYIKRRKRNWLASLEGDFRQEQIEMLSRLFPQAIFNTIPATTSIGNIGAVFHPGAFLLNYEAIREAQRAGTEYSFYLTGIASNPKVAACLEEIDQIRLQIAKHLGIPVFGLKSEPNDDRWKLLMDVLRRKEKASGGGVEELRRIRHDCLLEISGAITSAQHWLDYTYGVERIACEPLKDTIARTPTYQKRSVPQTRYVDEDIPTGLVPLYAIATRFGIGATPIKELINLYDSIFPEAEKTAWRDLQQFSTEFIIDYLRGTYFTVVG